ncbi:MAG: dihydropteroate synthase [Ginsengibacter sp.]
MFSLNCRGRLLLIEQPLVMGILNVNGDSFYAESRLQSAEAIFKKAGQMIHEGADILDIGGQSTRPGSARISPGEELSRVLPAIELIKKQFPEVIISVDTYDASVARQAVDAGASIVNDISAGEKDKTMHATVAKLGAPYICMHMKGTPETMQEEAVYENITKEVLDYFIRKIYQLRQAGIKDIIIDPGFGFAKTISQNLTLLRNLPLLKITNLPLVAGLSRKSTVYKTLNIPVENSLNGSTVLHTMALQNGADILRVHDVKEAKETIALFVAYGKA